MAAVPDEVELKNISVEKGEENANNEAVQLNDKKTPLDGRMLFAVCLGMQTK